MKSNRIKVQNKHKLEVFSTVSSLNCVLKIIGLSCTTQDHDKLKSSPFIFRVAIILICLFLYNAFSAYNKICNTIYYNHVLTFKDSLQFIFLLGYLQYIVDIYFVYKHKRESYLNYIRLYQCIDKVLGMTCYKEIKKNINRACVFFTIICFLAIITDFISWAISYGVVNQITYSIDYIYILLKLFSDLDYISNCTQVKYRLRTIGEKLQDYYHHANNVLAADKEAIHDQYRINWMKSMKIYHLNSRSFQQDVVMQLNRCYLLLLEQCEYINTTYGCRILFSYSNFLIFSIRLLNIIIDMIKGTSPMIYDAMHLQVVTVAMKSIASYLVTIYGVYRCEQNYRQVERILNTIDHLLINKSFDQQVRDSLKELRNLILTRPIIFHAVNFFKLEYPTLVSVASVVVTYNIILQTIN